MSVPRGYHLALTGADGDTVSTRYTRVAVQTCPSVCDRGLRCNSWFICVQSFAVLHRQADQRFGETHAPFLMVEATSSEF
jgi:hypothetical protein